MQTTKAKPFRVSSDWIWYAHGPGADSGQPSATALCDLASERDYALVADRSLVQEIVSVAGLYVGTYGGDADDRATARKAAGVIKRANVWLAENE